MVSKNKFFDKSKLPDNVVGYEYMEDTILPFLKKIIKVSKLFDGKMCRFFCEPIRDKKKKNEFGYPKIYDYNGSLIIGGFLDDTGIDNLHDGYLKYEGVVYWFNSKNMSVEVRTKFEGMSDNLKAQLGVIETNLNEVYEFLSFLEHKCVKLYIVSQYNVVAVFPDGTLYELGRESHDFYLGDFINPSTRIVDTKNLEKDDVIKNYKLLESFANDYGQFRPKMREEYEEFKKARREKLNE